MLFSTLFSIVGSDFASLKETSTIESVAYALGKAKIDEHYMNNLNVEQNHSMKDRFIVGFFLVVVTLPCIILGNYVFLTLLMFAAMIASHEIVKAPQSIEKKFNNIIYLFTYFMMFTMISWIIVKNNVILLRYNSFYIP